MAKEDKNIKYYPPVVALLGHVDHGKTTLLDAIRKTSIAKIESGGITQKIGASRIDLDHEGKKRSITFIDTPGHVAFANMRGRGVQASDIGLLIVAATDGIKPQTTESISLLKSSNTPYIVIITKVDIEHINTQKVKKQLVDEGVALEGLGGEIPVIEVSAVSGKNVKELLDLILLVNDLNPKEENLSPDSEFKGIVIESKQDPKSGARATVVIKNGKLNLRDEISTEDVRGRVKNLISYTGKSLKEATVGNVIEVLGFEKAPEVGSIVYKGLGLKRTEIESAPPGLYKKDNENIISVIIIADYKGSLEAILASLPPKIKVISKKTGEVTSADVLLAKSTGALVLSFNTKIKPDIIKLALTEKVLLKNYTVIYEMLDELRDVVEGKELSMQEEIFGLAKVLASFPFNKTKVMGIKVIDGRVAKGDKIRIERNNELIGNGRIVSVRQGKDSISNVEKASEAGIIVTPELDFDIGDMVICHS